MLRFGEAGIAQQQEELREACIAWNLVTGAFMRDIFPRNSVVTSLMLTVDDSGREGGPRSQSGRGSEVTDRRN